MLHFKGLPVGVNSNRSYGMKAPLYFISFLMMAFSLGCGRSGKSLNPNFEVEPGNGNKFVITSPDKDHLFYVRVEDHGNEIRYIFNGTVENKSDHIFENGSITLRVAYTFSTGKVYENLMSGVTDSFVLQMIRHWKGGEKRSLSHLVSVPFDTTYLDYPIKSVAAELEVVATDPMTGGLQTGVIASYDVTDDWKKTVGRYKTGKADCSYRVLMTNPASIFGQNTENPLK